MLISVALCTYNGELHIEEQLNSIVNQKVDDAVKIEIIIVDDNSTDNTISIINNISLPKNISLFIYKNKKNIGYVKNFEKAISICQGDYIFLSDQDDIWEKSKLSIMIKNISNNNILIYSNALLVDENLNSLHKNLLKKEDAINCKNNTHFIFNNSISGNTLMFKKKLKNYILPFPEKIQFHDIWIGFVASSISSIQFINKNLILYRQHNYNVTNITKRNKKQISYKDKILKKEKSFQNRISYLRAYSSFLTKNNIKLNNLVINNIYKEISNYNNYIFNKKLFLIFMKNRKKLFISKKQNKIIKIIKICFGLKAYKLLPFL